MYKKKITVYIYVLDLSSARHPLGVLEHIPHRYGVQVLDLYNLGQLGKQYLVFVFSPFLPHFHLFFIKYWHVSFLSHFYRKFKLVCLWNTLQQGIQVAIVRFLKSLHICKIITYHYTSFWRKFPLSHLLETWPQGHTYNTIFIFHTTNKW